MYSRLKEKLESLSSKHRTTNKSGRMTVFDRTSLELAAAIVCGIVAFAAFPTLWLLGHSLIQALWLTSALILLVFFVVMVFGLARAASDDWDGQGVEQHEDPAQSETQKLQSDAGQPADKQAARIAIISEDAAEAEHIAIELDRQGYSTHHTANVVAMFKKIRKRPCDWNFLIFDLDLFHDRKVRVSELITFRKKCAEIPVLLVARSVNRDELSGHRRAIGDATLRKPIRHSRLLEGIEAMQANWETRNSS